MRSKQGAGVSSGFMEREKVRVWAFSDEKKMGKIMNNTLFQSKKIKERERDQDQSWVLRFGSDIKFDKK